MQSRKLWSRRYEKTLDEVITVMDHVEFCCTNCKLQFDCDEVECFLEDALHYLKEYRKLDSLDAVAFPEDDNPPLTWDELKQMEGKPVWVEWTVKGVWHHGDWNLVNAQLGDRVWLIDGNGEEFDLLKEVQGTMWQAYRKERE